ncbi:MAG: ABC transporter ATP-binding protein [Lentisphaerae bacterium]|nr:ABC transporter ATP-binding protein [Lentisphaerota bacterium]
MIDIQDLSKRYGTVQAVDGLTLQVPRGELFCFLGPNGAGKTTTIKMLTGLVRPDSGRIRIGGIDIQAEPVRAKRLMGYIPDMPYLYERLTPVEFMHFVGDLYDVPRERVRRAVDTEFVRFGLDVYRDALIGDLSHGFRQRLIYVATFLHEPAVIFIDEPLVGLDPYTIRMIKDLLRERARQGMAIFLTTHILAVAEEIADRIGIIAGGRLAALGTLDTLVRGTAGGANLEDVFLKLTRPGGVTP